MTKRERKLVGKAIDALMSDTDGDFEKGMGLLARLAGRKDMYEEVIKTLRPVSVMEVMSQREKGQS